jgi:hypothetical protein
MRPNAQIVSRVIAAVTAIGRMALYALIRNFDTSQNSVC